MIDGTSASSFLRRPPNFEACRARNFLAAFCSSAAEHGTRDTLKSVSCFSATELVERDERRLVKTVAASQDLQIPQAYCQKSQNKPIGDNREADDKRAAVRHIKWSFQPGDGGRNTWRELE